MLNSNIEVRTSPIAGIGLFATAFIKQGEEIWSDSGQGLVRIDEIKSWDPSTRAIFLEHAWQVSEEWYKGDEDGIVSDPSLYTNHSCDPNTWFDVDQRTVARCDIPAGREVTIDYAMSEISDLAPILVADCRCGGYGCRSIVRNNDYAAIPDLRERYAGHVMSHVVESLNAD